MTTDPKKGMYAKIAIARKHLGMDEDTYRAKLMGEYGVASAKALNIHQLARLVHQFAQMGVVYTAPSKATNRKVRAAVRPDWIEITDSMPYAPIKRQILVIWRKLGYSMSSLDERVKRAFGVPVFVWMQNFDQLSILLSDLQRREKSFDKKHLATDATVATGETA